MGGSAPSGAGPGAAGDPARIRRAARAVVLAPDEQVLLVRFEFPGARRWALPGGGVEPGESATDALQREFREELGLQRAVIGPHIWNRLHMIPFLDGRFDGQAETIHLVEVDHAFTPQPEWSWERLRAEYVHEVRWWTVTEIERATARGHEVFAPARLGLLLRDLVTAGPPGTPVETGV